jgi:hypothetical protein
LSSVKDAATSGKLPKRVSARKKSRFTQEKSKSKSKLDDLLNQDQDLEPSTHKKGRKSAKKPARKANPLKKQAPVVKKPAASRKTSKTASNSEGTITMQSGLIHRQSPRCRTQEGQVTRTEDQKQAQAERNQMERDDAMWEDMFPKPNFLSRIEIH